MKTTRPYSQDGFVPGDKFRKATKKKIVQRTKSWEDSNRKYREKFRQAILLLRPDVKKSIEDQAKREGLSRVKYLVKLHFDHVKTNPNDRYVAKD